jgi:hypothetical protein
MIMINVQIYLHILFKLHKKNSCVTELWEFYRQIYDIKSPLRIPSTYSNYPHNLWTQTIK